MKILTVVGARPQFIKAAVVSRALAVQKNVQEFLLHTGQHFDHNMSELFFRELEIPKPAENLNIHGGSHGEMTGRMLEAMEKVFEREKPDWVLVYGDTNSTLAGALAAAKLNIPVAHVEAGLRSFNRAMPEEINRVLTDHTSSLLFTPTLSASKQLKKEGIAEASIQFVGDVMFDASLFYAERAEAQSRLLKTMGLAKGEYILATIHRQENTDSPERWNTLVNSMVKLAQDQAVVWPVHPRVRARLANELPTVPQNLKLIEPVGYLDMVQLEKNAAVIATDSGGVQKEAFFYRVPCVTLRDETEWTELVDSGWNRLTPPLDVDSVCTSVKSAIGKQGQNVSPYGSGNAGEEIARRLVQN